MTEEMNTNILEFDLGDEQAYSLYVIGHQLRFCWEQAFLLQKAILLVI